MPVFVEIQPLRQLIDDDAVILIDLNGFQFFCRNISSHKSVEILDLAVMETGGICFDLRPAVVQRLQHMHALALAGQHTDSFTVFIGFLADHHLLVHVDVRHCDRGSQHLPDGFLVLQVHRRAPVAARVLLPGVLQTGRRASGQTVRERRPAENPPPARAPQKARSL